MPTVSIYKQGILLGTGGNATTTSITTFSGTAPGNGRNVQVLITQAGAMVGSSYNTRVMSGSGTATLTMKDAIPYA
jgi:hypothetical protein